MLHGKNILAVIPARGGSKGIKLKNLIKLGNRSLVKWVADCVKACEIIDRAIVSTDHPEIKRVAEASGLECPFVRPDYLAGDVVSDVDVLCHAVHTFEQQTDIHYDIIVMLQPTSPFRRPSHINAVCNKLIHDNCDSVLTLSKSDPKTHPLKQLLFENNIVKYYDEAGKVIIARQQLPALYFRNGLAYAMTRDCLLVQKSTIGRHPSAVITEDRVVNIDSNEDVEYGQYLLDRKLVKQENDVGSY